MAPDRDGSGELLSDELVERRAPGVRGARRSPRRRRPHRHPRRQRAGRELLRPRQLHGIVVHRRVLLGPAERDLRPQRHDDRRLRLAAPDGANPPDQPVPGNFCTSAPARPFLYEGVFAHEYQHLLESLRGPGRGDLGQRGLSDWAHDADGLRRPDSCRSPTRASTRTSSASSAISASPRLRTRTPTRSRAAPRTRSRGGVTRVTTRSCATTEPRTR